MNRPNTQALLQIVITRIGTRILELVPLFSFISTIPMNAKKIKIRLKTRCSPQPIFSKIPPQEQGTKELKFKIMIIYAVNMTIIAKAAYKPTKRNLRTSKSKAMASSTIGTPHETYPAKALNNGDCPNCT